MCREMMKVKFPERHLSMTARHSFLQVKRLPRRRRKLPGLQLMGGAFCHSTMSSSAMGAGLIARVAPGMTTATTCQLYSPQRRLAHVVLSLQDMVGALEPCMTHTLVYFVANVISFPL